MDTNITAASGQRDIAAVRGLFLEYADWLGEDLWWRKHPPKRSLDGAPYGALLVRGLRGPPARKKSTLAAQERITRR